MPAKEQKNIVVIIKLACYVTLIFIFYFLLQSISINLSNRARLDEESLSKKVGHRTFQIF